MLAAVPPTAASFYPKCMSYLLTGLHCPGCGTTRAMHALLNGDVRQAVAYNPLALVAVPYIGLTLVRGLWHWAWGTRPRPGPRLPGWAWGIVTALVVAFWVLRNVPVEPFTLLAPHELAP